MKIIKWSNGEKYEQSKKKTIEKLENKWDNSPIPLGGIYIERNKNRDIEKRSEEILNRNMIKRSYQNPFFEGQNYTNVIVEQGKYLTPLNSNNINL